MGDREKTLAVEGNVLTASGELRWDENERFARLSCELLKADEDLLVVDLSGVKFIFSAAVAIISDLAIRAQEKGKRVEVRIPRRLEWILKNIWGAEERRSAQQNRMVPQALKAIEMQIVD